MAVLLTTIPVFIQAPWVRVAPMQAALFTVPVLALALLLERLGRERDSEPLRQLGVLLVGFCGSWLGGSLFWGWGRMHPIWHLPVEAFALPLALGGLNGPWRLAGSFYLASLLGTAATDGVMALTGLMRLWPAVLGAPLTEAPVLLQEAALMVLQPCNLLSVAAGAALLALICRSLWLRGGSARVSSATLGTTLVVDALFLATALLAPRWSGLI